jgi:hypothetical protein
VERGRGASVIRNQACTAADHDSSLEKAGALEENLRPRFVSLHITYVSASGPGTGGAPDLMTNEEAGTAWRAASISSRLGVAPGSERREPSGPALRARMEL